MYKYSVEPDNGFFKVCITFTGEDRETKEIVRDFTSSGSAYSFVESHLKTWLLDNLKKYIYHADYLSAASSHSFYNREKKLQSLYLLKTYLTVLSNESLRSITFQILNLEQDLRRILPSPSNPSYKSNYERIEEIVRISNRIRIHMKQTV